MKGKTKSPRQRFAIVVVDMLKDMVEGGRPFLMPAKFKREIIPKIKKFIDRGRQNGIPIIYVNDAHRPADPEFTDFERAVEHAIRGSNGAEVIDEVKPQQGDYIVEKRRFSGFYGTDLELLLSELGVNSVVIIGRPTNVCVLYTAADAFFRGYSVFVITDCSYSKTEIYHKMGLKNMFFAEQLSSEDFFKKFFGEG